MDSLDQQCLLTVVYYFKQGYYGHAQSMAEFVLQKSLGDPVFMFWRAVSMLFQDRSTEAVKELNLLVSKREVILAAPLALIFAFGLSSEDNHKNLAAANQKLQEATSSVQHERAYLHAAMFCWVVTGRYDDAGQYLQKIDDKNSVDLKATADTLALWIALDRTRLSKDRILAKLEDLLKRDQKNMWAALALVIHMGTIDPKKASDITAQISVIYPHCLPFRIERLAIDLALQSWNTLQDSIQELNASSEKYQVDQSTVLSLAHGRSISQHIDAVKANVLFLLCKQGNSGHAEQSLKVLLQIVKEKEPKSSKVHLKLANLLYLLWFRDAPTFFGLVIQLADMAKNLDPLNPEVAITFGNIYHQCGSFQKSLEAFESALKLDGTNMDALEGILDPCFNSFNDPLGKLRAKILLKTGLTGIEKEIELLNELRSTMGATGKSLLLKSELFSIANSQTQTNLAESMTAHLKALGNKPLVTYDNYVLVDPPYVMRAFEIVSAESKKASLSSDLVKMTGTLLGHLVEFMPGSPEVNLAFAKYQLLSKDPSAARITIQQCIKNDPTNIGAFILQAEILLSLKQAKAALQTLETCISQNFSAKSNPRYVLAKAQALRLVGNHIDAQDTIMPLVQQVVSGKSHDLTPQEVVLMYFEISDILVARESYADAQKFLREATPLIPPSSPLFAQIKLKQIDIDLASNAKDAATIIANLQTITYEPSSPDAFRMAKLKEAELYLTKLHDNVGYISCFQALVKHSPDFDTLMRLGDAFIRISESLRAIEIFKLVGDRYPYRVGEVATKIGRTYVRTYQFAEAIAHYRDTIENEPKMVNLNFDLATLYFKLDKFHEAKLILNELADLETTAPEELKYKVLAIALLGDIYRQESNVKLAIEHYKKTLSVLGSMTQRYGIDTDVGGASASTVKNAINLRLAETLTLSHEREQAISAYSEALQDETDPNRAQISLALAKLYLEVNDASSAQAQCSKVLKLDAGNEEAALAGARIAFQQKKYPEALSMLKQLIAKCPTNWTALGAYIETLRKAGKFESGEEVETCFKKAECFLGGAVFKTPTASRNGSADFSAGAVPIPDSSSSKTSGDDFLDAGKAHMHGGYHYCRGLYFRALGRLNEAVKSFYSCKSNATFGDWALQAIIEIYLNPEGQSLDNGDFERPNMLESRDSSNVAIATKLLDELSSRSAVMKQVLAAQIRLLGRNKQEIEKCAEVLEAIVTDRLDHLPAIATLCVCYNSLKQSSKLKLLLSRAVKFPSSFESLDYLEKCHILYAEQLIQSGKLSAAVEALKQCISLNASNVKAYELMGLVREKEGDYASSTHYFEMAWKFSKESSVTIGTKLAYSNYRAKKFVEAIDVARAVLLIDSSAKGNRDVIEKSRANIRMPT